MCMPTSNSRASLAGNFPNESRSSTPCRGRASGSSTRRCCGHASSDDREGGVQRTWQGATVTGVTALLPPVIPPKDVLLGHSPFPPIADLAFLSDCETTALVAPSGNIEWMCLPRTDGPSVFGAMLDRDAGGFRLGPSDTTVPAGRRYLPGTMVLETTWGTRTGWIIIRDVLLIGPWHHEKDRSHTHRRSPSDYDAHHVLMR